jgi:hypothetical protein
VLAANQSRPFSCENCTEARVEFARSVTGSIVVDLLRVVDVILVIVPSAFLSGFFDACRIVVVG